MTKGGKSKMGSNFIWNRDDKASSGNTSSYNTSRAGSSSDNTSSNAPALQAPAPTSSSDPEEWSPDESFYRKVNLDEQIELLLQRAKSSSASSGHDVLIHMTWRNKVTTWHVTLY